MTTITGHTSRAAGTILTASIYNADHNVHVTNAQNLNSDKVEGATPPVVDGDAVLFDGTGGASFKTAGFAPADESRNLTAGTGLTGGGDLTADRSFAADLASQAEAEAGTDNTVLMTPLRAAQYVATLFASQAEAEAGTDNTVLMTPLRTEQWKDNTIASQAQAEAGTDNSELMTALRTAQAIAALATTSITLDRQTGINTSSPWDTGVSAADGGMFLVSRGGGVSTPDARISLDGGSTYTNIVTNMADDDWLFIAAKGTTVYGLFYDEGGSPSVNQVALTGLTGGGNIFFNSDGSSGDINVIRFI